MKGDYGRKLHGKLQLMYRNAQRLLNLVNQLLDFRKNEMAGLHLTCPRGILWRMCVASVLLS